MEAGTQENLTCNQEEETCTQEDVTCNQEDVPGASRSKCLLRTGSLFSQVSLDGEEVGEGGGEDHHGGGAKWPLLRHISQLSQLSHLSLEEGQEDPGQGRAVSLSSTISITSNSEYLRWQNSQVLEGAAALLEAATVRCHRYYVIAFLEPEGGEGGGLAEAGRGRVDEEEEARQRRSVMVEEDSARRRRVMFHSVTPLLAEGEGGEPLVIFTVAMRTEAGRLCSIHRWVEVITTVIRSKSMLPHPSGHLDIIHGFYLPWPAGAWASSATSSTPCSWSTPPLWTPVWSCRSRTGTSAAASSQPSATPSSPCSTTSPRSTPSYSLTPSALSSLTRTSLSSPK